MKKILIAPLKVYQKWISPAFPPRCKYYPSCSQYAVDAISEYGFRGIAMALWRLVRCNPWSHGGVDYVPARTKKMSSTSQKPSLKPSLKPSEMAK